MKLDQFCIKFLRFGVYASLVAPLIVFPLTIYPYLYGKALYINILVALMLPFYVMLIMLKPEFAPKKNLMFSIVTAFFGVLVLSSVLGQDLRHSFWGSQERSAGLFFMVHYFVLFLIAISVFRDFNSWKRLLTFSLFISVLVMGSAWWDIAMDKIWKPGAGTRTGGALSNPIFYAAYLLFHIPMALMLFLDSSKKKLKATFILIMLVETASLLFTLTRGAMLAFVVMIFSGFILVGVTSKIYRKLTVKVVTALIFLITMLFVSRDTTIRWPVIGRFVSISPKEITAKTRLEAWRIAWQGFTDKPGLGWGHDNYYLVFNKFYKPEFLRFSYYETWSDRPHNIVFEILATTGVLGIITYFGIYASVVIGALRSMRKRLCAPRVVIPLLMILAGYLVQNLFGIDSASTYLMFYTILAFASFLFFESPKKEVAHVVDVSLRPYAPSAKRSAILAGTVIGILSFISIWQWNIEPAYAGYLTARATAVPTFGDAIDLWQKAIRVRTPWSYDAEVEYLKGVTRLAQRATSVEYNELLPLLEKGDEAARSLTNSFPQNSYYNYLVGRFYSEWGKFEFKYFEESEKYLRASIALSPKRQQLFYGLGRMFLLSGRTEEALQVFKDLVELDSGVDESHWFYGLALQQAGKGEEAYQEIKEAIRLGYKAVEAGEVLVLAEVATKEKDLNALQDIYENAIAIDGKNADWYARLAALYLELGKREEARALVLKAVELDPTLREEATKFLKLLNK